MSTYTYTNTLTVIECARCHMDFAVQQEFDRDRRRDHKSFYCPSGCSNFYPQKSDTEKLREQLDREAQRAARLTSQLDQAEAGRSAAQRRVVAMKGVVTKTKKRVAAGKCVRCSAQFPDIATHMAEAHPDYAPESDA